MKTITRKPRNLKPEATIAAELAAAAQLHAREANSATLTSAVRDIIAGYIAAEKAVNVARDAVVTAEEAARTKLEETYIALAAFSHANEMTPEMIKTSLDAAIIHFYGAKAAALGVGTAPKLRAQLSRAMQPKIRAQVPALIKPWADAWEAETLAIAAERNLAETEGRPVKPIATPIREKFGNRGNTVTQALQLALGSPAKLNRAGDKVVTPAVASVTADSVDSVLSWVKAHPRVSRGATAPVAVPEVAALPPDAKPREVATARVQALINAVQDVAKDYPAATALFADVMAALRHCTGDRLLPSTVAEKAADKPLKAAPAEPIAGAADIDGALSDSDARELALLRQLHALRAGK